MLCLRNDGYAASLERGKVYARVTDVLAAERSLVRVVDESGEDYLFPASYFVAIELPEQARRALRPAS